MLYLSIIGLSFYYCFIGLYIRFRSEGNEGISSYSFCSLFHIYPFHWLWSLSVSFYCVELIVFCFHSLSGRTFIVRCFIHLQSVHSPLSFLAPPTDDVTACLNQSCFLYPRTRLKLVFSSALYLFSIFCFICLSVYIFHLYS